MIGKRHRAPPSVDPFDVCRRIRADGRQRVKCKIGPSEFVRPPKARAACTRLPFDIVCISSGNQQQFDLVGQTVTGIRGGKAQKRERVLVLLPAPGLAGGRIVRPARARTEQGNEPRAAGGGEFPAFVHVRNSYHGPAALYRRFHNGGDADSVDATVGTVEYNPRACETKKCTCSSARRVFPPSGSLGSWKPMSRSRPPVNCWWKISICRWIRPCGRGWRRKRHSTKRWSAVQSEGCSSRVTASTRRAIWWSPCMDSASTSSRRVRVCRNWRPTAFRWPPT